MEILKSLIIGIARQAIQSGHTRDIFIYHGARKNSDLYLDNELRLLVEQYSNIHYFPCVTREPPEGDARQGRANDLAMEDKYELNDFSIYLCGNPEMVNNTKRQMFLAGASLQNIHADAFVFS